MRQQIWHPWEFQICTNVDPKPGIRAPSLALSHSFIKSYWVHPILSPESSYFLCFWCHALSVVLSFHTWFTDPTNSCLTHPSSSMPSQWSVKSRSPSFSEESKLPNCGFKCLFDLFPCLVSCLICYLPILSSHAMSHLWTNYLWFPQVDTVHVYLCVFANTNIVPFAENAFPTVLSTSFHLDLSS